jgi:hypothetical protein
VPARNYVAELDVFSDTSSKSREHITGVSNGTNRFKMKAKLYQLLSSSSGTWVFQLTEA